MKINAEKFKKWYLKNMIYVYSVGITVIVMLAMWIFNGLGPFGGNNMMLIDGIHQYVPFFSEYYDKLKNGGSLLYTWDVGMGGNFLSLFSYYLSSPLNLIILLFDKMHLVDGVSLVLTIKFILTSFCMAYFLKNKRGEKAHDLVLAALTLAYTFSAFVIGYNWCTMWMDVIMVFPLILLGFERLMEDKDYRLYVVALFYTLFCNYYMGFIVCVFLIFWFFMYEHKSVKRFFINGIRFAIGSLTGAAMAAVLLLPAYFGIMNTASGNSMALPESKWYGNILIILQKVLVAIEPLTNQTFDGGANLYCGIFVLLGALLFLFQGRVKLWTRLRYVLMLVFLAVSMNNELLNYIWHAFHNQYGIPNRFSFCFIMLLILMADKAFAVMEQKKKTGYLLISTVLLVLAVLGMYWFVEDKLPLYCYIISVAAVDVYCVIIFLYMTGKLRRLAFSVLFSVFAIVEILGNGIYGLADNGSVITKSYLQDTDSVALLKEYMDRENGTEFFRADLLKSRMLDEATWHNLHSIGIFGSTVPGDMVTAMGKLGFYTGANEYLYHGSTPLTNSILNIKYALVRPDAYNQLGFSYVTEEGEVSLYENPYYLPIGFMVNKELLDIDMNSWDLFVMQNNIAKLATDVQTDLFTKFDFDCEVSATDAGVSYDRKLHQISYTKQGSDATTISAEFTVLQDMDLYLHCKGSNIKNITLYIDGLQMSQERHQGQIFHVGNVTAGQQIEIEYLMNSGGNLQGTLQLYAAYFDNSLYEEVYNQLSQTVLTDVSYRDGYICGTINADRDGLLFTSIPYDDGWKAYVDGEEVEIELVFDSFIGLNIEKSTHKIEFKYTTVGLKYGIILSVVGWCIFLVMMGTAAWRRKKEGSGSEEVNQEGDYSGSGTGNAISSGDQGDSKGNASDSGYSDDSVHCSGSGGQRD